MIVASNNNGKLREIKSIFGDYEVYSLKEKNITVDVVEDADSFYGNSLKKAKEIYELVGEPVLADDSGLCITALDDFPGVMTHRFLGDEATDEERNIALIDKLNGISDRSAKVMCVMVYYDGVDVLVGEGILYGQISTTRRGTNGFGFDEIFELSDGRTLAELPSDEKNMLSARYLALKDLKSKLDDKLKYSKNTR